MIFRRTSPLVSLRRRCLGTSAADIDLYYSPTPNGWKVSIALEEMGLPYNLFPIDLAAGDQFDPAFLKISPNNRMPAIVDHGCGDSSSPLTVFESGATLLHLGRRTGQFLPPESELKHRKEVEEWLFWQVGGLGPMAGQLSHFRNYAPAVDPEADHTYGVKRYGGEYERLLKVMDNRLRDEPYLAASRYTVADMACFGWTLSYKNFGVDLTQFPSLKRWYDELKVRPALRRGVNLGKEAEPISTRLVKGTSGEALDRLFNQDKQSSS